MKNTASQPCNEARFQLAGVLITTLNHGQGRLADREYIPGCSNGAA
ncbi:MAG: hypothetical protein CM15mP77_1860 [Synechococcus sp.]|nr:MAG: hypothetical protein CM15mP77_1860 [Synechococcus sp.]